jgi:hypothetical protein
MCREYFGGRQVLGLAVPAAQEISVYSPHPARLVARSNTNSSELDTKLNLAKKLFLLGHPAAKIYIACTAWNRFVPAGDLAHQFDPDLSHLNASSPGAGCCTINQTMYKTLLAAVRSSRSCVFVWPAEHFQRCERLTLRHNSGFRVGPNSLMHQFVLRF